MTDIGRFGYQGVVQPAYYKVREFSPMFGVWQVLIYHLDDHGSATVSGQAVLADGERLEDLPTLEEALALHMKPALAEAEANQKTWLENRPPPEERPEPEPEPMDEATRRLLSDGGEVDYEDLQHRRWRG